MANVFLGVSSGNVDKGSGGDIAQYMELVGRARRPYPHVAIAVHIKLGG